MRTGGTARGRTTNALADVSGEDRSTLIRAAALHLFATQGYRATTMADIGERLGIRGPSLYKHVTSKHDLLVEIVEATMRSLITEHDAAVASIDEPTERLRRAAAAHARFHAGHAHEASVGTRELDNLEPKARRRALTLRSDYELRFRRIIEDGVARGDFDVESARVASFAILDMGMGIPVWFRSRGELSPNEIARHHGELAVRMMAPRQP